MTERPLVSVIIPYFKQERYVCETVRSVEAQTYPEIEIIVVDDGSPVAAEEVLTVDGRIQLYRTPNRGAASARNTGFTRSNGDYVLFLDSDDRLTPGAIERHLAAFAQQPEAGLAFGAARVIDENGQQVMSPSLCRPRRDYFLKLMEGNPIACPGAALLRRDAFAKAGGFDELFYRRFPNAEDFHLYLRMARRYPLVRHPYCVVDYRLHTSSKSQNKKRVFNATIAALDELAQRYTLSPEQRSRIEYGKRKIAHTFAQDRSFRHKLEGLYFQFHAIRDVPLGAFLKGEAILS